MDEIDLCTSERRLTNKFHFHSNLGKSDENSLNQFRVISNGTVKQNKFIQLKANKEQNFHSLTIRFVESIEISGLSIRFRLRNWNDVQYLAIGSNVGGEFHHVKITNPKIGEWQIITFSFEDLAYQIQNGFDGYRQLLVNDLSIKLKGEKPSGDSYIDILEVQFWEEELGVEYEWLNLDSHQRLRWNLIDRIHNYQTSSIKHYAKSSLNSGGFSFCIGQIKIRNLQN